MTYEQLQLNLLYLIIFCFCMMFLSTIVRLIKILVYKKVDNADDVLTLLMFWIFIGIFVYIYYYIKSIFKKRTRKRN